MRYRTRLALVVLTAGITGSMARVVDAGRGPGLAQQIQQQLCSSNSWTSSRSRKMTRPTAKKAAADDAAAAKKELAELNNSIKEAQHALTTRPKARRTLEDQIVAAQAADSDFGKLRDALRAADQKYQEARKSVLQSDDFKERLAQAHESDEAATAVLALKKEFEAMPEIAEPRTKFHELKQTYEPLRTKLVEADPKWANADKEVKDKKTALDDAKKQYADAKTAAAKAKSAAHKVAAESPAQPATPKKNAKQQGGL